MSTNRAKFKAGEVAIIGKPNVGKSTIINELVGQKITITSHRAQTTRRRLVAIASGKDYQIILVDTPGIEQGGKHLMHRMMNQTAISAINNVALIIWVIEANRYTVADKRIAQHLASVKAPILACINKIDKLSDKTELLDLLTIIAAQHQLVGLIPISAYQRRDINYLRSQILQYLPEHPPMIADNLLSLTSTRVIVAEFIREKLMRYLQHELPYSTEVVIDRFAQTDKLYRIEAIILVEKLTQKAIVIGKNGQLIKRIGSDARREIQALLGSKIFLRLVVKVKANWQNNQALLKGLNDNNQL